MKLDDDLITTVVGSYPAKPSKERLSQSYHSKEDPFQESMRKAVRAQLESGVELISDGQTRRGMIDLYAQGLRGFRSKEKLEIVSEISYKDPITVEDQRTVRRIIGGSIGLKGIITGPWTLYKSSEDKHYEDKEEGAMDIAKALKEEAEKLSKMCDVVQVDEPFLSVEYPSFAKELVETVLNVNVPTALHVCGDVSEIAEELVGYNIDILDHEFAENPDLYDVYDDLSFSQRLAVGVVTTKPNIESMDTVKERIERALDLFGPSIMIDPDCGLRNLEVKTAKKKLERMVEARDVISYERS